MGEAGDDDASSRVRHQISRVTVIIPVHDETRPIARTLQSLAHSGVDFDDLLVLVVCHNVQAERIRLQLNSVTSVRFQLVECADGLPSPAGPRALALALATSEYVSFLDSDDSLEPGALARWRALADRHRLDAVIPRERHASGKKIRTPPVRPFRTLHLDAFRDRLAYRTAPLGLLRRETLLSAGVTFGANLTNGSDQIFGLQMWFGSERVAYDRRGPAYVVGDDAVTRVTRTPKPLRVEMQASVDVMNGEWFAALPPRVRQMIATKFVRVHLFDGVNRRLEAAEWTTEDHQSAAEFIQLACKNAPGYDLSLGRVEAQLVQALVDVSVAPVDLLSRARRRRRFFSVSALVATRVRHSLRHDAPIRLFAASMLA